MYVGTPRRRFGVRAAAEAARAAPAAPHPPRSTDLVLDGLATRFTEGPGAGVPALRRALQAYSEEPLEGPEEIMRWLLLAPVVQSITVFELWDDEAFHALATRAVQLARDTGALTVLPVTLVYRSGVHLFAGEFAAASALIGEADAIALATGNPGLAYARLLLGAWRGVEAEAMEQIDAGLEARARGEGGGDAPAMPPPCSTTAWAATTPRVDGAARGSDGGDWGYAGASLPELVEAATRSGKPEIAAAALRSPRKRARAPRAPTGRSGSLPGHRRCS